MDNNEQFQVEVALKDIEPLSKLINAYADLIADNNVINSLNKK